MSLLKRARSMLANLSAKAQKEIGFRNKIKTLREDPELLPETLEEEGFEFTDGADEIYKQDQRSRNNGTGGKERKKRRKRVKFSEDIEDRNKEDDIEDEEEYNAYKNLFKRVKTVDAENGANIKNKALVKFDLSSQNEALTSRIKDFHTDTEFIDNLVLTSKTPLKFDSKLVDDGNKCDEYFLSLAKEAFDTGSKLCKRYKIPFRRPNDYYAEMIKTDKHMDKIRSSIVNETLAIEASEKAKHNRNNTKFFKKVQALKLQERSELKSKNLKLIEAAKKSKTIDSFLDKEDTPLNNNNKSHSNHGKKTHRKNNPAKMCKVRPPSRKKVASMKKKHPKKKRR